MSLRNHFHINLRCSGTHLNHFDIPRNGSGAPRNDSDIHLNDSGTRVMIRTYT